MMKLGLKLSVGQGWARLRSSRPRVPLLSAVSVCLLAAAFLTMNAGVALAAGHGAAERSHRTGVAVASGQDLKKLAERAQEAAAVLEEIMQTPEQSIPGWLLEDSECVAVIPGVVKVGFIFGARHGKGLVSCRTKDGWSRPSFVSISGGSFGLQIGAQSTDFVLVFANRRAAERLTENKFTLGADASVAAGPVGRTAEAGTDIKLQTEIYSYSRNRGLFVGISLEGATLNTDQDANWAVYDERVIPEELLFAGGASVPATVSPFVGALARHAPQGS